MMSNDFEKNNPIWVVKGNNVPDYEWTTQLQILDAEDQIDFFKDALLGQIERLAKLKSGVYDDK